MIPYRSFPTVELGPLTLHTFGLATAAGVLIGFHLLQVHGRDHGLDLASLSRLATRLVVAGVIGARAAYVLSRAGHFLGRPLDAFAIWDGGLQFFGGLVAGVAVLWWWLRANRGVSALVVADGIAFALAAGLAAGRAGCFAVGEHLGGTTRFPLGIRYLGGRTIEGPLAVGTTVHSTALYEAVGVLVLVGVLTRLRRRPVPAGTMLAVAALWYGGQRFLTDFLRAYDRRFLGLTTAQFACVGLVLVGAGMRLRLRGRARALGDASVRPGRAGEPPLQMAGPR